MSLCSAPAEDVSSELSIELSQYEEPPPSLSPFTHEEEECDEEDEELPSFLQAAKSERRRKFGKGKKNILALSLDLVGVTQIVFVSQSPL